MNYSSTNSTLVLGSTPIPQNVKLDRVWAYVCVGIYIPLSIAITLGNFLVIAAFFTTPKLKTKTNYFIVSLAVADLIVGTFSVPMWIYFLITQDFEHPLYNIFQPVDMVSGVSSIMHLTCISLERCYAIMAPLKHMRIKKGVLYTAIVMSWSLGILSSVFKTSMGWDKGFVLTLLTSVFFFTPLLVIFVAYSLIFVTARRSITAHRGRSLKKDLHIAYTIAVVIGIFLICWLPFFTVTLLYPYCQSCTFFKDLRVTMRILMTVKIFHYSNSVFNPIIYCVRNKRFYLAFVRILSRAFFCKDNNSQNDELDSTRLNYKMTIRKNNTKCEGLDETARLTVHLNGKSRQV